MSPTLTPPPATLPALPANAPFTAAQRAWLNGFFAGLLGMDDSAGRPVEPAADLLPAPAAAEEDHPWHDPALPMEERLKLAEGRPIRSVLMAAMAQLDCGACGYVCRTYSEAIATGREKNLTLCSPGGKETWKKLKEIIAASRSEMGAPETALAAAARTPTNGNGKRPGHDRKNPFPARFLRNVRLNKAGSSKDTRHIALDLEGSGLVYEVGDSLGVYPENCPELVQSILEALGASGSEKVPGADGHEVSLREALSSQRAVTKPSDGVLSLLSAGASGAEAARLRALHGGDLAEESTNEFDLLDLLAEFPSSRPVPAELVASLPAMQPRLYSISSSLKAHPDEVHLTVRAVRYRSNGRARKGVASTFLADRVEPGQRVRVFVQPSHGFRLPASPDTPMIMVGPGTGVAPFRAFLEERRAVGGRGRNWLFFGDREREHDFLYREELEEFVRQGILTRLDAAFSRDGDRKDYVQHRMEESAAEVWAWLQEGATFYVCGDASRMARDVDEALKRIVAAQGALSADAAKAYVDDLARAKRYQRDVY